MDNLCYGQQIDHRCGLVFPWYTPAMIEKLRAWELHDKRVFEFGGGMSTVWYAHYAREIHTVESDYDWYYKIKFELDKYSLKGNVMYRQTIANEVELKSAYVQAIYEVPGEFDIIVVDGSFRDECIATALTKIKDGGIIICDNWNQSYVWDAIMGSRLLDGYEHEIFVDPDHKDHDGRPWATGYWIIDKSKPHLLNVTGDYDSHRPMLWMALEHVKPMNEGERGDVVELGCGYGSTPLLHRYCEMQRRMFLSVETNREWADQFPGIPIHLTEDWYKLYINAPGQVFADIVFIDNAPGETRKDLIPYFANTVKIIIVHDTEDGAEHDYKMAASLNAFKYRCDLVIEWAPRTTAVSNVYDFERWKGLTLGKYKFI
jgi:hypothetical protein